MRSDLTRDPRDRRFAECRNGKPPCRLAPAPAPNPLGLCDGHLEAYRVRCGVPTPPPCPACHPLAVMVNGTPVYPVGGMCFACGLTTTNAPASERHQAQARAEMRSRLLALWRAGDRGPEWMALLARCPAEMREAFERRLASARTPLTKSTSPALDPARDGI